MRLAHLPPRPVKDKPVAETGSLPKAPLTVLRFDGSCRPNPGPMGIGFLLEDSSSSRILVRVGAQIGQGTNNAAEYQALLAGLRHALRLGLWDVMILTDSQLVANQIKGSWGVKDKGLARLHREAQLLLKLCRTWSITHNYREANGLADDLSRQLVFEEPTLPALPSDTGSRFPRALYDWQAAAIRFWWQNFHPGSGTLSRIFGVPTSSIEQIGYGKTYRDATFAGYQQYLTEAYTTHPPLLGTFNCPICGHDKPHQHTTQEIEAASSPA